MDGIALRAVVHELQGVLTGGRVDKIHQPEPDQLILHIRQGGVSRRLLLSASAHHCRLHLTQANWPNPAQAPMLCMLLRKHLTGARVSQITQHGLERIVRIVFEGADELGRPVTYALMAEIMGRHSNIILTGKDQTIIDSVKHIPPSVSRVRQVLPGLAYVLPPAQDKLNPLAMDAKDFTLLLFSRTGGALHRFLSARLFGISQNTAKDLVEAGLREYTASTALSSEQIRVFAAYLEEFFQKINQNAFSPTMVLDTDGRAAAFAPYRPALPQEMLAPQPDMSTMLERYYLERDQKERIGQKAQALVQALGVRLERSRTRLALHHGVLASPEKGETYRLYGELLTANLHALAKGMHTARVADYYSPEGKTIDIPLDARLSPAENAQRYYKLYAKQKSALENAKMQAAIAQSEIVYLKGLLFHISQCTETAELNEIRSELEQEGILRASAAKKKKRTLPSTKPLCFHSSDGLEIRVGKNNAQNDELTLRWARPDDIWLHAKDIPGSHVVIRTEGQEVPNKTLSEAATLAALHSAGKNAGTVPIDYTLKKHVKKPGKAKPGMVVYTHQKTLFMKPDPDAVKGVSPVT